jgi:uncharacterized protein YegP (UPF0339 family)
MSALLVVLMWSVRSPTFHLSGNRCGRHSHSLGVSAETRQWLSPIIVTSQFTKVNSTRRRLVTLTIQIRSAAGGQYYVRLVAANGRTLAHSESYTAKSSARNCAEIIKNEAGGAAIEDWT